MGGCVDRQGGEILIRWDPERRRPSFATLDNFRAYPYRDRQLLPPRIHERWCDLVARLFFFPLPDDVNLCMRWAVELRAIEREWSDCRNVITTPSDEMSELCDQLFGEAADHR